MAAPANRNSGAAFFERYASIPRSTSRSSILLLVVGMLPIQFLNLAGRHVHGLTVELRSFTNRQFH